MVRTSARLLKLLSLLQSRRFWTRGELARELAITERSVRRDADALAAMANACRDAEVLRFGYSSHSGAPARARGVLTRWDPQAAKRAP